ncbi:hypothetical protein ACSQ67_008877 [Phaseolus vulgaris]
MFLGSNSPRRGGLLFGGGEGGGHEERGVTITQRRWKINGLVDLEGSKSHPRRSVRIETNARRMHYPLFLDKVCLQFLFRWRY